MYALSHSDIVGAFYDAAAEADLWPKAAQMLCTHFGSITSRIEVRDKKTLKSRLGISGGDRNVYEPFLEKYWDVMPMHVAASQAELDTPVPANQLFKYYGKASMLKIATSKMTWDWAIPNRIRDGVFLSVLKRPDRSGFVSICMNNARKRADDMDVQHLAALAPHIRRAVVIQDMFDKDDGKLQLYQKVIDALSQAVLIVSGDMKLLYANTTACELLREGAAVTQSGSIVKFTGPKSNNAIGRAVFEGRQDEIAVSYHGIDVAVNEHNTIVAHVLPISQRDPSLRVHPEGVAAIFIAHRAAAPLPPLEALAALFGLTPAERRITRYAVDGFSRQEIARASGVTENTVRTQLDAVYSKANVSSQRELTRLMTDLTPAVRAETDE